MNANAKENLAKARANLLNGDEVEAIMCYSALATEDPKNGEAVFFSAHADYVVTFSEYSEGEGGNRTDLKNAFNKMENSLKSAVESVAKSEGTKEEKLAVIKKIVDFYIPVPDFVIKIKLIAPSGIEARVMNLYHLASYIENGFNSDKEAMKIAIDPLKEAVKLQQKFYAYKYDGIKAEDTVARIQKVDPSYTIPKKAGCVTLG